MPIKKYTAATAKKIAEDKPCPHSYLVPLEVRFGKAIYPNGQAFGKEYDWFSNIIGAHVSRVDIYFCPACRKEIKAPVREET